MCSLWVCKHLCGWMSVFSMRVLVRARVHEHTHTHVLTEDVYTRQVTHIKRLFSYVCLVKVGGL